MEQERPKQAVVTGTSPSKDEPVKLPRFGYLDRAAVILVGDTDVGGNCSDVLDRVFVNEKVCLAMRACRPLRMTAAAAAADPSLAGEGTEVPRILVLDPVSEKVKVLEKSRLKATTLLKEMQKASRGVWKEKIESVVKEHMALLTKRDRLYDLLTVARGTLQRAAESTEEERAEAAARIEELTAQIAELRKREKAMWKLTRAWVAPEDPNPPPPEPELPDGWSIVRKPGSPPYYVRPDGTTTYDPPPAPQDKG